jgi:hypothetical protein
MAYSSGGIIEATDFNLRANQINALWGTGSAGNGYGQSTTITTTSAGTVVPATDWSTLIARMNSIQNHQYASGTGITSPTSGAIITYLNTVDTFITNMINSKYTYASFGAYTPGTANTNATSWSTNSLKTFTFTFSSGDAARYFFNAGGRIGIQSNTNTITSPSAGTAWNSFVNTGFNYWTLGSNVSAHAGTVGTYTRNVYTSTSGYYNLTTTPTSFFTLVETGTGNANYNNNVIDLKVAGGAPFGANSDKGAVIIVQFNLYDNDTNTFGRTNGGTTTATPFVIYPESTNLTNTWGTVNFNGNVNTQA